jgi:hypothetical protein
LQRLGFGHPDIHPVIISASSTIKTGRHDIAEILLKVPLNTKNQIKTSSL